MPAEDQDILRAEGIFYRALDQLGQNTIRGAHVVEGKVPALMKGEATMARMPPKVEEHKREVAQAELETRMSQGKISVGAAVREIRQRFVGITLEDYARVCGLSKTTLMNIERDDPRVLLESVKKAVEPLGYQLSLVPAEDL
jgi:DNA-binding XRE family transcriptional regulator